MAAEDGEEGLKLIEQHEPDLVVSQRRIDAKNGRLIAV